MPYSKDLLISINYESTSGGIARVARLISECLDNPQIISFHGDQKEKGVTYHQKRIIPFFLQLFITIFKTRPQRIIFDHIGPASLLKFIPRRWTRNSKIVIFLHDEEAWKPISKRHRWGVERAQLLLCNSEYTFKKFVNSNPKFVTKTKTCLLAGVPVSFISPQLYSTSKVEKYKDLKYCLFISRLWKEHRYKGYIELIEAFHLLNQKEVDNDLYLVIVGRGNDVEYVLHEIHRKQLQDKIVVHTDIDDNELAYLYKHSLALVFPSIREGFGFVFLEAMYFGKATIGVQGQPAEEIIVQGYSGELLQDNTPASIYNTLKDINTNSEKYDEYGKNGKIIYNQKFTNEHFKERFLKCLEE